jgi:hypothetical protein
MDEKTQEANIRDLLKTLLAQRPPAGTAAPAKK